MADTPNIVIPVSEENAQAERMAGPASDARRKRTDEDAEREKRREQVVKAMKRWRLCTEADVDQRVQEIEDLRFDRGRLEDQWDATQVQNRAGGYSEDGVPIAARPCLVINKLDVPVQQVINEGRQSRLALVVKPRPGKGSEKDAEVRQGMLRAIEVDSDAHSARMWAYERAVKCGRGYYRVDVKFANDGDFLVDLVVARFKNQGSVYVDPYHEEPDASDMTFAFITEDLPKDEYEAKYGEQFRDILTLSGDQLTSVTDRAKDWITGESVRVAEHFWVESTRKYLCQYMQPDGQWGPAEMKDEKPADADAAYVKHRPVDVKKVHWMLHNALDVIEIMEWEGRYIPIIQVIGKEYNVDGKASWKGVITNSKDPQRIYNYAVSAEVEAVALAPRAPYIAAYGQIEKFKRVWDQMNIRNFTYLPYTAQAAGGTLVPPPQRNVVEPAIGGIAQLVQQADNDIKATTGRWDASLGQMNPAERSGKALREMKMQAELGSSNYLESLAKSIRHEGRILLDLLPHVYHEPGRIARIIGDTPEDDKGQVMLNAPFVRDTKGAPQPPPTGAAAFFDTIKRGVTGAPPPVIEQYDLTKGDYSIIVDVGPSYKTQRDENVAFLQSMIEADPNLAPIIGDIMAEEIGGPMGRKLAKRIRTLNPNLKPDEGTQDPEQLSAQVGQLELQMQKMQEALDQATKAVETQEARQKAAIQVAQFKAQADIEVAKVNLQREMQKIRSKITSDEELARFDAAMKLAMQNDEQQHEKEMLRLEAMTTQRFESEQAEKQFARSETAAQRQAMREETRERVHHRLEGIAQEDADRRKHALAAQLDEAKHRRERAAAAEAAAGERMGTNMDFARDRLATLTDAERARQDAEVEAARATEQADAQRQHELELATTPKPPPPPVEPTE